MKLLAFVALTLVCGMAAARDVGQIPANIDQSGLAEAGYGPVTT